MIALPQSPHACTLDLASAECLAARLLCLQCLAVPAHALLERLRHALARTEAPALQVWCNRPPTTPCGPASNPVSPPVASDAAAAGRCGGSWWSAAA
ncbi:MAG: hypothetical protein JSS44_01380 [Proteobacteria bacterium]|nr:hypothetical protein [Pseudomonadota bacterium]